MKDEKIENLEGNLSKIIDTAALFVSIVAILLAIITSLIGVIVNSTIKKKLTILSEKENNISDVNIKIIQEIENVKNIHKDIEGRQKHIEQLHASLSKLDEWKRDTDDTISLYGTIHSYINAELRASALILKIMSRRLRHD